MTTPKILARKITELVTASEEHAQELEPQARAATLTSRTDFFVSLSYSYRNQKIKIEPPHDIYKKSDISLKIDLVSLEFDFGNFLNWVIARLKNVLQVLNFVSSVGPAQTPAIRK